MNVYTVDINLALVNGDDRSTAMCRLYGEPIAVQCRGITTEYPDVMRAEPTDIQRTLIHSGRATTAVTFAAVAITLLPASCGMHPVAVEFYLADGYHFSEGERDAIQTIADRTVREVRNALPALPADLDLKVQAGTKVVAETGETGYAEAPNLIYWTVDPHRPGGVTAIARAHLRASLFEFLHRLVRGQTVKSSSLMDQVVSDGMATVFERDFAGTSPPWGVYPANVMDWVNELMALPPTMELDDVQAEGRRWMGFEAGTYLVDRAMRSSGKSSAQLVSTSTADVIRMALGRSYLPARGRLTPTTAQSTNITHISTEAPPNAMIIGWSRTPRACVAIASVDGRAAIDGWRAPAAESSADGALATG